VTYASEAGSAALPLIQSETATQRAGGWASRPSLVSFLREPGGEGMFDRADGQDAPDAGQHALRGIGIAMLLSLPLWGVIGLAGFWLFGA
jgi:hypothetical protein